MRLRSTAAYNFFWHLGCYFWVNTDSCTHAAPSLDSNFVDLTGIHESAESVLAKLRMKSFLHNKIAQIALDVTQHRSLRRLRTKNS